MACDEDTERGARLLADLEVILESDPDIDELGFVLPSQLVNLHSLPRGSEVSFALEIEEDNRVAGVIDTMAERNVENPTGSGYDVTAFWLADHKLAIAVPALQSLYRAAELGFVAAREAASNHFEKCRDNSARSPECASKMMDIEVRLLKCTRALVIVNSDNPTAWNTRKRIMCRSKSSQLLMNELRLSSLLLTYGPKSEETWAHRRWVISRLFSAGYNDIYAIIESESNLVELVAETALTARFFGWDVTEITDELPGMEASLLACVVYVLLPDTSVLKQVEVELRRTRRWGALHVADNCCFHYRRCMLQHFISKCYNSTVNWGTASAVWKEELDWNGDLLARYLGREALWVHRRFLIHGFMSHEELLKFPVESSEKRDSCPNSASLAAFVLKELCFLNSCIGNSLLEEVSRQQEFCCTHKLWLLFVMQKMATEHCEELDTTLQQELGTLVAVAPHRERLWGGLKRHFAGSS